MEEQAIELPEPTGWVRACDVGDRETAMRYAIYTADQVRAAVLVERERCAKLCESRYMGDNTREDMEARNCAAAIRSGKPTP
jgi:hypothetical protein